MDKVLQEADLRGLSRVEALFKLSLGLELDQEVPPEEIHEWRGELEVEYLKKDLKMPFGKWLQFIVKRRLGD